VGALGTDHSNPIYGGLADFSNAGPNDFYNPQTHQTITGVRAAVSICAPGTDLILAAYVGSTGANSGGNLFDLTGIDPSLYNQLYFTGAGGTSFSSPVVAGGAALVVDAGYANFGGGKAVDGRVVKAVLLNSANKPAGWTNNTVNVGGVLKTTQGLDWNFGAGALNLDKGYDQYLSGTTDVPGLTGGTVHNLGWDYGHASLGLSNDYFLENSLHQGDTLTATLTWFVNVFFNSSATADANDNFSDSDLHNTYFDQMDLQVWLLNGGVPTTLIADSTSPYNNVDHLFFSIPQDGMYAVRVSWLGDTYDLTGSAPQGNDYAVAWSAATPVPEPTTLVMILSPTMALLLRRSRKN